LAELAEHLGGHLNRTHTDRGILRWFLENHDIRSMLDVGCGPGGQVELAREWGIDAWGIDGDHTLDRPGDHYIIHDYCVGPSTFDRPVDLVWSCEFVEHVDEQYVPNFVADFARGRWLCMSYAPPGHDGHHHVNCQPEDYWIECLQQHGFRYRSDITAQVRRASTQAKKFMRKRGLVFESTLR
jgi:hypothetical protein